MAMYVEILSTALAADDGSDDLPALTRRAQQARMNRPHAPRSEPISVSAAIAAEVAYDGALVQVCGKYGIETEPERFASPTTERQRLERELGLRGIDLVSAAEDSQTQPPSRTHTAQASS